MSDVIEHERFGSFYEPKLKTSSGLDIPNDFKGLDITANRINFYAGFKDPKYPSLNISPILPPKITYWTYTGLKGSFNFIGGRTNIFEFSPTTVPYNDIPIPPSIISNDVISVTVNGVLIYDYEIQEIGSTKYLIMDESGLLYPIETDDCIRVEVAQS